MQNPDCGFPPEIYYRDIDASCQHLHMRKIYTMKYSCGYSDQGMFEPSSILSAKLFFG